MSVASRLKIGASTGGALEIAVVFDSGWVEHGNPTAGMASRVVASFPTRALIALALDTRSDTCGLGGIELEDGPW